MELIKNHGEESIIIHRLVDSAIIVSTLLTSVLLYIGEVNLNYLVIVSLMVFVFTLSSEVTKLYQMSNLVSIKQSHICLWLSWVASITCLLLITFFSKETVNFSRVVIGIWFIATPILMSSWRAIYRYIEHNYYSKSYEQKAIIIGATPSGIALANEIKNKSLGLKLVGVYDDREDSRLSISSTPFIVNGKINDALSLAKERSFRHVYVALPMEANNRIKQIIKYFSDSTARVYIVPDFFTYDLIQSRWKNVGTVPTLSVHDTPFYGASTFIKRVEDVILSFFILLLISPVLLFVAIGVKASSPGPVIFKQIRYGIDGKPIKVWKFRSMKSMDNGNVVKQATKNDPRVTRFGAFIRRTSLDELPQFINVLQGRMSIVGPRPHAVAHNEEYRQLVDRYMLRHKVKPGITGWAQVNGFRGETDTLDKMEKRIEFDLRYIQS
ncbi:undecaprenyl-phosphate glucose phosphotransferase, partial [Vibrio makurazakiensis]|uniref:undecaprenyl-phosphate glucose phosphotransferase n=1 Tax=Vibrio makurazakiensis TaxID=2910250 RepID=UPI003D0A3DEC